ncbi:22081_t:CDS:1, partial [Racocetra persica]
YEKVFDMSRIQEEILYTKKLKKLSNLDIVYQHKYLALLVSNNQESLQDKAQLYNNNEIQSKSDYSILLSENNDDSETYEEDEEIISNSEIIESEQLEKM